MRQDTSPISVDPVLCPTVQNSASPKDALALFSKSVCKFALFFSGMYPGTVSISTVAPSAIAPARSARSTFVLASRIASAVRPRT